MRSGQRFASYTTPVPVEPVSIGGGSARSLVESLRLFPVFEVPTVPSGPAGSNSSPVQQRRPCLAQKCRRAAMGSEGRPTPS